MLIAVSFQLTVELEAEDLVEDVLDTLREAAMEDEIQDAITAHLDHGQAKLEDLLDFRVDYEGKA